MFIYVVTTTDWDNRNEITLFSTYEKAVGWLAESAREDARRRHPPEEVNGDLVDLLDKLYQRWSIDQHRVDPSI